MYSASVAVAATALIHCSVGAWALTLTGRGNASVDVLFQHDPGCEHEKLEGQACDIAERAQGVLSAQRAVRPLFVKFHKVGGTTLMELINNFMGVNTNCGRTCGDCYCEGEATTCTGHSSRVVLQHYVMAAQDDPNSFLQGAKASVDTQLISAHERRHGFNIMDTERGNDYYGGVPMKWYPGKHDHESDLLFITLLRDPVERVRSKYYFTLARRHCADPCEAREMSFADWLVHMEHDAETCCEYVNSFGLGSVETSKKVLASLFDVVGFTEEMDQVYVDVAKQFGVPISHLPETITCRDNAYQKEDWTDRELQLAKKMAAKDIELYQFAQALMKNRKQALLQKGSMIA